MRDASRFRPEWRISSWLAVRRWEVRDDEEVVENPFFICSSIGRCLGEPFARRQLLDLLAAASGHAPRLRWADDAAHIGRRIEEAFRVGTLVLVRPRRERAAASGGAAPKKDDASALRAKSPAPPAPANKPPATSAKTWIEFLLVDQEDKPVPNERYKIKVTDGSVREGRLDEDGRVRINNIDPGNCMISFPDLDAKDWAAA